MTVVPFKPPEIFKRYGIDWTREPASDRERTLREAFLAYETSSIPNGSHHCSRSSAVAAVRLPPISTPPQPTPKSASA
jgi:hypothetical protein